MSEELDRTKALVAKQQSIQKVNWKTLVTVGAYWKPLATTLGLMFFQQFSGINAVSFNIQFIFAEANTGLSPCKAGVLSLSTVLFSPKTA